MDELVQKSRLGKATVYRLYRTKDALIGAYLSRLAGDIASAIAARTADHRGDPRGTLLAIAHDMADDLRRPDFRGCAFNNASIDFDDPDYLARVRARDYRTCLLTTFTKLAEELTPRGGAALGAQLAVLPVVAGDLAGEVEEGKRPPGRSQR